MSCIKTYTYIIIFNIIYFYITWSFFHENIKYFFNIFINMK